MENRLAIQMQTLNDIRREIIRLSQPQLIAKHSTPNKIADLNISLKACIEKIANFGTRSPVVQVELTCQDLPGVYVVYYSGVTKEDAELYVKSILAARKEKWEIKSTIYLELGLKNLF